MTVSLAQLLRLAWPIVVSRSTQVVVGLSDSLMVASLGETALAAVTAGGMNAWAGFIFPMGIVFIVSSFSSQLTGQGDALAARRYGWYGLILAALTQVLVLVTLPGLPWLMRQFGYAPDVEAAMLSYLTIRFLSTGAAVGIEALGNYYGGTGNTAILMKANVVAMGLNVVLNWVLIFGHLGFPAMGVEGAAIASAVSTGIAFAGFLAVFVWQGRHLPAARLRMHEFTQMLRVGLPSGFNWSFEFFAFIAFVNIVVASLGTYVLAALMTVIQINSMAFMPTFGLASAGAILVGQSIGAGDKDRVPAILWLTFRTAAIWMGCLGLVYWLMPEQVLVPFASQGLSADFLTVGARMLALSALWQIFDAAGITVTETLRAAGDTAYPMWVRGLLAWGMFLPGSWITIRYFGGTDVSAMLWLIADLSLLAGILYWRFRSGAWRNIELIEGPGAAH